MRWKGLVFVGISLLVVAAVGLFTHSNVRLVVVDLFAAVAAIAAAVMARNNRGGTTVANAMLMVVGVAVLSILLSAVTLKAAPWLTALMLAAGFAFAFTAWTSLSPGGRDQRQAPR
jgi:uncharacterized membrane protein SirB2